MFVRHMANDNTFTAGGDGHGAYVFSQSPVKVVWATLKFAEHLQTTIFTPSREWRGRVEQGENAHLLFLIIMYHFFKQKFKQKQAKAIVAGFYR